MSASRSESETRVEVLEAALRGLLNNLGGHSHWREGGAGGRCETCVSQSKAASRARDALSPFPPTSKEDRDG